MATLLARRGFIEEICMHHLLFENVVAGLLGTWWIGSSGLPTSFLCRVLRHVGACFFGGPQLR